MVELNTKTVGAIALAIIIVLAGILLLQPQKTGDIENPEYIDPGVLEGSKLLPEEQTPATEFSPGENCDSLSSEYYRDECYIAQADNIQSIESCTKITELAKKNACIEALAVDLENTSLCNYMKSAFTPEDNSNVKYMCITAVAEYASESEGEAICNQIPDSEWKEHCKNTVNESLITA